MSPKGRPKLPIDIYVRVSRVNGRDVEAEGMTAAQQEKKCRAQLEALDLEVGEVFVDLDQSGGKESRPQYDKMKARVANGQSGGCCVYKLSRFGRRVRNVLRDIAWLEDHGAAFVCVNPGIDTSNPYGRFMLTVFAALDELELDNLTEGWAGVRKNEIDAGRYLGPVVPVGYSRGDDKRLVPNEYAPLVLKAFEMRAGGASLAEIGKFLRENKVPSNHARGAKWSRPGVGALLKSDIYLGRIQSGEHENNNAHEAIVPQRLFQAVQRTWGLENRHSRLGRDGKPPALLQGVIRCSSCGGSMSRQNMTRPNGDKFPIYRCQGTTCPKRVSIGLDAVNALAIDVFTESITVAFRDRRPDRGEEINRLEDELNETEEQIREFKGAFLERGLSATDTADMLKALLDEKEELEGALSKVAVENTPIELPEELRDELRIGPDGRLLVGKESLRELLATYTNDAGRNAAMRRAFQRVVIAPGKQGARGRDAIAKRVTFEMHPGLEGQAASRK